MNQHVPTIWRGDRGISNWRGKMLWREQRRRMAYEPQTAVVNSVVRRRAHGKARFYSQTKLWMSCLRGKAWLATRN